MHIAKCMYEFAGLQAGYLRHHHGEQCVGSDIKRYTQEHICAALVELAAEPAIGHIKLEQCVARAEPHFGQVGYIPCVHDHAAAVGIGLYLVQYVFYLVVDLTISACPAAPLMAIYRPQAAVLIRPFIPYAYSMFFEISNIGIALQEPQQLIDNRLQVQLFSGHQGETLLQVEPHLVTKTAGGACAGTVGFFGAGVYYMLE